jgi:hypothetical protein
MEPYDAAAKAREIVQAALGSSPVVLAVLEAKADSWVHRLVPAIATALTAAYAAGAQAHVEHHRCERCYAAGQKDARAQDVGELEYCGWVGAAERVRNLPLRDAPRG